MFRLSIGNAKLIAYQRFINMRYMKAAFWQLNGPADASRSTYA